MFLLGNYETYGSRLTAHANSGDFHTLTKDGRIVAVYCLARRGNLLVQPGDHAKEDEILDAIVRDSDAEIRCGGFLVRIRSARLCGKGWWTSVLVAAHLPQGN